MAWPGKLTGSNPLVSWLNSVLANAKRTEIKSGPGYRVKQNGESGVTLEILGTGGGTQASTIQQFRIKTDEGDYWGCCKWDGTTETYADGVSLLYAVAKPHKLRCDVGKITSETIRGDTFDYAYALSGSYYVRTVTVSGSTVERDVIIPDPLVNDIIYAVSGFSTTSPSTLADCEWLDMNVDGRAWGEI